MISQSNQLIKLSCKCQVNLNILFKVAYGVNFIDSVIPLPCFHLTIHAIHSIYYHKGILMRNILRIPKLPSQQGAIVGVQIEETCSVFKQSSYIPLRRTRDPQISQIRRKDQYGRLGITFFLSNFYSVQILWSFLSEFLLITRKKCTYQFLDSIIFAKFSYSYAEFQVNLLTFDT